MILARAGFQAAKSRNSKNSTVAVKIISRLRSRVCDSKTRRFMWILVTILASFLLSEFIGYVMHRTVHHPISGFAYRSHLVHHSIYRPDDFVSKKYRSAGSHSLLVYAAPVFILTAVLVFLLVPFWYALLAVGVMAVVSIVNNSVHDLTHLEEHHLYRYKWFRHAVKHHRYHHINCKNQYSITFFWFDRLFGTFKPLNEIPDYEKGGKKSSKPASSQ